MVELTTTDMALIDKIFGMYGGYVLDFSNDRFAAFFNRDLKIDIYHDRYAIYGLQREAFPCVPRDLPGRRRSSHAHCVVGISRNRNA